MCLATESTLKKEIRMKILVFDDSQLHRKAAELTLKGHDLTIVGTYDEAQKALTPQKNDEGAKKLALQLLVESGVPNGFKPWDKSSSDTEENRRKFWEAQDRAEKETKIYPDFDVVLTDLMVLPSAQAQADRERFAREEMPLGTTIALLALYAGVKNVAVVTDANHHEHPASAAFDCFHQDASKAQGINLLCTNRVDSIVVDEKTGKIVEREVWEKLPRVEGGDYPWCQGVKRGGKNWGQVLQQLLAQKGS